MRYLLSLGFIILTLFIFSAPTKAADVLRISNYKTINLDKKVIPIEPIEPKTNKSKFWEKKFKFNQQQTEVKPIPSYWYMIMLVLTILSIPALIATGIFIIILISYIAIELELAIIAISAFVLLGVIVSILYAIKLYDAMRGEETYMKGWRFVLGYIASVFFLIAGGWGTAILVFNIIDHLRYLQYLKSLDNKPQ